MSILRRYIAKSIIQATLLVMLIFMAVLFLLLLIGEFKNIGEGDYHFTQAIFYVLLRLPNQLYQISPMVILVGNMMGLGLLTTYRELMVMQASGYPMHRVMVSVMMAGLIWVLAMSLIGELLAPNLSYRGEVRKENAQNAGQAVITAS